MKQAPLFITTDAVGGVWNYSVALAQGLARSGRLTTIAVLGPPADAARARAVAVIPGCTLLQTGLPLEWQLGDRPALDRLIAALIDMATDVGACGAHLHAPALAASGWPAPTVTVAHSCMATWWHAVRGGDLPRDIVWHAEATAQGMAASQATVAPSAAFADALVRCYRPYRAPQIVRNGLPDWQGSAVPRGDFVLTAGRLWDEGKNMAVLDEAAATLDFPIYAAGPHNAPGASPVMLRRLRKLGVLASADLHACMAEAAIFASPSRYEPFGLAVLEAAQRSTPLVLADIPTFRELWSEAAMFVDPDRPSDWAGCLRSLRACADTRRQLGAAAKRRAARYTQQAMVTATMRLHDELALPASQAA